MHTRSSNSELTPLQDNINGRGWKSRARRNIQEELEITTSNMAAAEQRDEQREEHRALRDYSMPNINGLQSSIVRQAIAANTFEIKSGTIQMVQNLVQFGGAVTDDPNEHLLSFIEICDTFRYNGVTEDTEDIIRLRLFPFSLRDKARSWLHSLPPGSITTWEDLAQKFLAKFFPMAETAKLRIAISQFEQQQGESLYEAWERYKEMLRKWPHYGMPDWMVIITFYNGLG